MTRATDYLRRHPAAWPILGALLFYLLIGGVTGSFDPTVVFTGARLATFAALLGLAQMVVVTSGDGAIDLSQIYILTLCAFASTTLMDADPVLGFVLAVLLGALCGLVNGLVNVVVRVPAMVATLATGYIFFTAVLVGSAHMKVLPDPGFVRFVTRDVGPVSVQTLVVVVVAAGLGVLLYRSPYGKQLHAVGQNRTAATLAGLPSRRVVVTAFVIGGALCGLAGVLAAAVMGGAFQDMGLAYFLPSVAATFVGGTAASGGRSNVLGVAVGALMMTLMSSFLNTAESTYHLPSGVKQLVMGAFLVSILLLSVSAGKPRVRRSRLATA
ncbi:ABC transporter permease [Cellulomonas sp. C5510]|uniref:ABC transporter permease n=1 Tax=Cellulomonas sp. C5510 TaxID=2871170 RepID=UPI001C970638|nr:ABC transporter permease [Cellulomonas sp. C5510]QZN85373.1 ABC transporter permease [Cellulomonas sp. C5510]